ncbi:PREDICTED: Retrovirus-related Pol poly from, partial [Prunus dulcis]
ESASMLNLSEGHNQAFDHTRLKWRNQNDVLAQCNLCVVDPEKYEDAKQDESWLKAIEDELFMIEKNARLVAKGYAQKSGLDYNEIMHRLLDSIRTLIALAAQKSWKLYQLDVKSAFLNGVLQEEVYVQQPEGFVVKGKEEK